MTGNNHFYNSKSNKLFLSHLVPFEYCCLSNIYYPLKHSNLKNSDLSVESILSYKATLKVVQTLTHIYLLDMSIECCFGRTLNVTDKL